jgi:putative spermidine/putrescine transport system ATP-binding protein
LPVLVLLDEPGGALDNKLRENLNYDKKRLHAQLGVTVLYVTHDQGEALTMSDRIAVFNEGCIQQVGHPRSIYDRPDTAFVAQVIGENNRIEGTVTRLADGIAAIEVAYGMTVLAEAGPGVAVAERALVSLRPERVCLGKTDSPRANSFDGRILEVIYHGDHLRMRLAVLGRDDFIVKTPVIGANGLADGADVSIGWRESDGRALPL